MVKTDESGGKRESVFRVGLVPINEHISTDGLLQKLRLMAAGCGLKVTSAERIDDQDDDEQSAGFMLV